MLKNTKGFCKAADYFRVHGKYDCGTKGSMAYKKYWEEERQKCLFGTRIGKLWIPGYYYFYLNYCPIELVENNSKSKKKSSSADRRVDFPRFWDVDYMFFMCCYIARYGVQSLDPLGEDDYDRGYKEYKELPVDLNIQDDEENLSGGKHILYLKPRGVGYSFKAASMVSRNFHLVPRMKNYFFADDRQYLLKDGVFTKFVAYKTFLDSNTEFGATCEEKESITDMWYKSSYKNSLGKTAGMESEVIGVTFKNDPEKARGKRGIIAFFEEFGKFPNVDEAWNIALSSFEEGGNVYGLMVGGGTGGSTGNDFYSMSVMSKNPKAYRILAFNNIWDAGMEGTTFCMFTPAYMNVSYVDQHGNSLIEQAKYEYDKKREAALTSPDPALIERVKAEAPYTPQEAMLNVNSNIFMVEGIGDWMNKVTSDSRIHSLGVAKELYRDSNGKISAKLNSEHKPIMTYPHNPKDDVFGSVVEWSEPFKDSDGKVPDGLYIIGHDPYAEDNAEDLTSLGSAYVYMNPNNIVAGDLGDRLVASWNGRPTTTDEYNRILFMLAERYNAKIGFENDRGDVLGYAKRYNLTDYLSEEFDLAWDEKIVTKRKNTHKYGMRMGSGVLNTRILTGNRYIADWLYQERTVDENGKFSRNYNYIYDQGLFEELKQYNGKRNADRVSALRVLMYHAKELAYNGSVLTKTKFKKSSSISKFFSNR